MLKNLSIKSLYVLALAEGEGVGTAYEYFAKRLVLRRWLASQKKVNHVLLAGLPEKYGSSLDFLQIADELGAEVVVADERPWALDKLQKSLAIAREEGWLRKTPPKFQSLNDMADLSTIGGHYDLIISSEVLQRLSHDERKAYAEGVTEIGMSAAIFTPNAGNPAHTNVSGLSGLNLDDLKRLFTQALTGSSTPVFGYIDMPPFPPGITRSDAQREQATSGKLEALAMWGLGWVAQSERVLPISIRRRKSHIVYALINGIKTIS